MPPPPVPPTPLQQPTAPPQQPPVPPQPTPVVAQTPPAQQTLYEQQAPPAPVSTGREHRRFDWVIGVVLGIVLGLAVAAGFVFVGSEDTVDAPRIHGVDAGKPGEDARGGGQAEPERLPAE
jgi:hypothetical protein